MLYVFKIIRKKIEYFPKREGVFQQVKGKNKAAGNFGGTILYSNC